jgi:nicotinamide riboside transporter PnuC
MDQKSMLSVISSLGPAAIAIIGFISTISGVTAIYFVSLLRRRTTGDHSPQGF